MRMALAAILAAGFATEVDAQLRWDEYFLSQPCIRLVTTMEQHLDSGEENLLAGTSVAFLNGLWLGTGGVIGNPMEAFEHFREHCLSRPGDSSFSIGLDLGQMASRGALD